MNRIEGYEVADPSEVQEDVEGGAEAEREERWGSVEQVFHRQLEQ